MRQFEWNATEDQLFDATFGDQNLIFDDLARGRFSRSGSALTIDSGPYVLRLNQLSKVNETIWAAKRNRAGAYVLNIRSGGLDYMLDGNTALDLGEEKAQEIYLAGSLRLVSPEVLSIVETRLTLAKDAVFFADGSAFTSARPAAAHLAVESLSDYSRISANDRARFCFYNFREAALATDLFLAEEAEAAVYAGRIRLSGNHHVADTSRLALCSGNESGDRAETVTFNRYAANVSSAAELKFNAKAYAVNRDIGFNLYDSAAVWLVGAADALDFGALKYKVAFRFRTAPFGQSVPGKVETLYLPPLSLENYNAMLAKMCLCIDDKPVAPPDIYANFLVERLPELGNIVRIQPKFQK